jgi:hypothetical protein
VELAREAGALELLRLHDAAERIEADALGEIDRDRGARDEGLREPDVPLLEPRVGAELVVRHDDPERPAANGEGEVDRRRDAELARNPLIDLGVVDHRVHALRVAPLEDPADLRGAELQLDADEVLAPGGRPHAQRPLGVRQCDQDDPRSDELLHAARDEVEERAELDLRCERVPDLVERLELTKPAGRGLVEPRVLDRDGGLRREELGELLVLLRELGAVLLLGEVKVAVGDAAQHDRHAEERAHGRVVAREADRPRVLGDVVEAERLRVTDEHSQEPAPPWELADRRVRLGIDARREEPLEALSGAVDHAERGIARGRQLCCGRHDPLEQRVERELRRQSDA